MDFETSPSGSVVRNVQGYASFIPHPLPPAFEWTTALVNSLSRADRVLGMLSIEGSKLPNPHLLIRPFIASEAVHSSRIEGTQATLGDVLGNDVGFGVKSHPDDLQEVHNYILALDYGMERLKSFPLSLRLLRDIHRQLMQGVRGSHATPGEFRRSQNWIGSPGCTLAGAKYVPPGPEVLMECLGVFEEFLHDTSLPPLIHAALCHYQFEAIHPFLDGNGRVGRLLITLLLHAHNVLSSPLLYLSAFFESSREVYYRHLYQVSKEGDWEEWLIYFLNGVAVQGLDVLSRTERINGLLMQWKIKVGAEISRGILIDIITSLAVNPFITINRVAETMDVAFTTAQRAVMKLAALGIVSQVSEGRRDRVFCAREILQILEEPTHMNTYV